MSPYRRLQARRTERSVHDTTLAQAAKPALGEAGFVMMAIAALLATSSSVNADIYAATGSTAKLAESGMFPPVFGQLARVGGTRGLVTRSSPCWASRTSST